MSDWRPHLFQTRVAEKLLAGKSIILQAPTGSGKTTAALLPFLHGWREETTEKFPTKCVYTVPMRVLANQFVVEYKDRAASFNRRFRKDLRVEIQTGEQQGDKKFESDLIFCTIDQFLSSYLTMPYSLPKRLANLNAGAMVGSYLIFDEFHLLDPGSTLPSTLFTLRQLRKVAPVLLMTATFSKAMLQTLADFLDAEVELVSPEEARAIETRNGKEQPRQRVWRTEEDFLTPEAVLASHQTRSLALCNTVQRAQNLYRSIRDLVEIQGLNIEVLLLHSRFLPEDRRKTEETLRQRFGKDAEKSGSLIAIATQTIEVGVDITCKTLHTELAPASALIQRAGRCARYPGEQGEVIVYPVETYMPYGQEKKNLAEEDYWVKEMKAAFAWLEAHKDEPFDFGREQEFVDAVATARDEQVLKSLSAGRNTRAEAIYAVLEGNRQGEDQRLLVRDADSRLVLIHDDPDALVKNPYAATGFSLQIGTLYGMYKRWEERFQALDIDWAVKRLMEDKDSSADKKEENRTEYDWQPLNHSSLLTGTRVLLVHPALAGYLPDEGFVADKGDTPFRSSLPGKAQERTWEGYSYKLESYEEHIRLVLEAFRELALPELEYPAKALDAAAHAAGLGWLEDGMMKAAWLVCLLHDVGKLSTGWQNWVRAYQKEIGRPVSKEFAAAHTDSEWGNENHRQADKVASKKYPKPHHAGESAWAVAPILVRALGQTELARAALAAITRHHTPFASECQTYSLESRAARHIQATLAYVPENIRNGMDLSLLKNAQPQAPKTNLSFLVKPNQEMGWLAYTLLARALRRADQEGTQRGSS